MRGTAVRINLVLGHGRHGIARHASHLDGRGTGEFFGPDGSDGLTHNDGVSFFVGHCHGTTRHAINEEGLHLELGESAAHSVRVHDGQASLGGGDERLHGIAAADFVGDEGGSRYTDVFFDGPEGVVGLEIAHLFDTDRGKRQCRRRRSLLSRRAVLRGPVRSLVPTSG